jgi:Zn/Cd-binding protein ZinT
MWDNCLCRRKKIEKTTKKSVKCYWGLRLIDDSSAKGLTAVTLKFSEKNKLELKRCRGQGYDIAANMKGKNSGVQNILDENPLAFLCHTGAIIRIFCSTLFLLS